MALQKKFKGICSNLSAKIKSRLKTLPRADSKTQMIEDFEVFWYWITAWNLPLNDSGLPE